MPSRRFLALALVTLLAPSSAPSEVIWEETPTHRIKIKVVDGKEVGRWEFRKKEPSPLDAPASRRRLQTMLEGDLSWLDEDPAPAEAPPARRRERPRSSDRSPTRPRGAPPEDTWASLRLPFSPRRRFASLPYDAEVDKAIALKREGDVLVGRRRYREAVTVLEDAAELHVEVYHPHTVTTGWAFAALAGAYQKARRSDAALAAYEAALRNVTRNAHSGKNVQKVRDLFSRFGLFLDETGNRDRRMFLQSDRNSFEARYSAAKRAGEAY